MNESNADERAEGEPATLAAAEIGAVDALRRKPMKVIATVDPESAVALAAFLGAKRVPCQTQTVTDR
jgi:hypothetical protein